MEFLGAMEFGRLEALNQSAHLCLCQVDHRKVQLRGWRMTLLHAQQYIFIKMPTVSRLRSKLSVVASIGRNDQSSSCFFYSSLLNQFITTSATN